MKPWMKYTMAATVFAVGVGGSIVYNQFLAPYFTSQWVYVATTPLGPNKPIGNQFVRERLPDSAVSPGAITQMMQLQGNYTTQRMAARQQFTSVNVQPNPYTITKGYEDVPIPSGWIAAVSDTIRQGDDVSLVPLSPQNGLQPGSVLLHTDLNHLLVLSVHTQNNQEVLTSPQVGVQSEGTRQFGTGSPANLDLKMTTKQAQAVARYIAEGEKLFILGVAAKG